MKLKQYLTLSLAAATMASTFQACRPKGAGGALSGNAAERVYVAPGEYDEFYTFTSGGFSGQMTVYGLPSGRLLKQIPVFSVNAENAWGFSEETKPMLQTSHGFVPWDDLHHIESSFTEGMPDGRWMFANSNNTPRLARIDLTTFTTAEILEIPNTGGNHCSPFTTENSEYVIAATRFSVPPDGPESDVPIDSYKQNFTGHISFVSIEKESGEMNIAFQLKTPGLNFDLSSAGKGVSDGWLFISCYNSEQAHTLLEVNASQNDKDFIMAVNWKKAEEYFKAGKGKKQTNVRYAHNKFDHKTHTATSEMKTEVTVLDVADFEDLAYLIPCPKSPHGADVSPTGEFIVGSGKLAALIPVFSFEKLQKAINSADFEGERYGGIPVVNYESVLHGEVQKPGLGPLHTEFDEKGNAYTSFFVSSEVVKWDLKTLEVLDRQPTYYSVGHLMVAGGNAKTPYGKYLVAYNKITKDRFLPTGPELAHSAQLFDISGEKMELLLDFPTLGEPHYAQAIPADLIKDKSVKIYDINANEHPHKTNGEAEARVERNGNIVRVYMTTIRSHLTPDVIEGIQLGDEVYFHVTNLEQDWDMPHGFAIKGNNNSELLVMPGETITLKWVPDRVGIFPFYCTDFCSALHQEMSGYARVSPKGSNVPIKYYTGQQAQ
ncbi:Sec-dependent nitrous-oxide reductase [Sphingobacterium sp. FBM7-1]|uniref:Sec-dependent nitrous-oxide reductase n=1 Tax=Sphingobacterium sp. FBM7-1 TaxID=2886688 RepID=UPI001D12DEA4|nr:Sec-dependent nitrous-oxide reductase [Sphingobacterium sp. FBM7-1]MCC2600548.1 Sec-dependent nitrous-oxide reductase [Sphingobacterium sp. FBM7-1]